MVWENYQFWSLSSTKKLLQSIYNLQAIRPTVGGHQPKSSLSRRDEVVVKRLRIGHTWCTHSYLLTGEDQPECTTCQCPLTVKHTVVVVAYDYVIVMIIIIIIFIHSEWPHVQALASYIPVVTESWAGQQGGGPHLLLPLNNSNYGWPYCQAHPCQLF